MDFGVLGDYSREAGKSFETALRQFVDAPGTTLVEGKYRGQEARLYVDPEYGRLLVASTKKEFVTAFGNLSPAKIESIVMRGAG
jgi:hypothetical protein